MRLHYALKFVDDMDSAVVSRRGKLGLTLGSSSPAVLSVLLSRH